MSNERSIICIAGSAQTEVRVPASVVQQCHTLFNMLDDTSDHSTLEHIPMPSISGSTLETIVQFCENYPASTGESEPDPDHHPDPVAYFADAPVKLLLELTVAANFLYHPKLLKSLIQALADTIGVNKSPADIKTTFGISADAEFTTAEIKRARTMFPGLDDNEK
jgi:hypothetical protein